MQLTKISSIRSQQLAFPHSNRPKQITAFDEDTIFSVKIVIYAF